MRPAGETTRTSAELDNGLTEDLWASLLDPETGAVTDQVAFYSAIALGGVCDGRRGVAWRLLLQEYGLHHGEAERSARDAEVEAAYHAQSTEYKLAALTKVDTKLSLSRFIEHCDVIDQDVERSDFHEDETGEFSRMLRSILRTYVWHNPDTGYVQGMLGEPPLPTYLPALPALPAAYRSPHPLNPCAKEAEFPFPFQICSNRSCTLLGWSRAPTTASRTC